MLFKIYSCMKRKGRKKAGLVFEEKAKITVIIAIVLILRCCKTEGEEWTSRVAVKGIQGYLLRALHPLTRYIHNTHFIFLSPFLLLLPSSFSFLLSLPLLRSPS